MKIVLSVIIGVFILSGCNTKSISLPVQIGKNSYMATAQAEMYLKSSEQTDLISNSSAMCQSQGLNFMLDRTEKKMGKYDRPNYMEIYFKCVSDTEYKSVTLTKDADVKIEMK